MVVLVEKVYLYLISVLFQTLFFQDVDGDHLEILGINGLLASN
mgnify:CR=1 FL=1